MDKRRRLDSRRRVVDWHLYVRFLLGTVEFFLSQMGLYDSLANSLHIFEMPLLGYGGYLPFGLELYALYNLVTGLLRDCRRDYVQLNGC